MGRPPLPPGKRKRPSMAFRPTPEMHGKLKDATGASGLSLTQEVERRLEQSFRDEDAIGGAETSAVLKLMAAGASIVQHRTGKSWTEDWGTFVAVQKCWKTLVAAVRPDPPRAVRTAFEDEIPERPKRPESPQPPKPSSGGVGLLMAKPSDEDQQAYEEKLAASDAAYDKAMVRYEQRHERYERQQQAVDERIKEFVGLGKGVAADLFPKRRKTKG